MYTLSRSRVLDFDKCARYEYWKYEHAGRGIEGPGDGLSRARGIALHQALANMSLTQPERKDPIQLFRDLTAERKAEPWEFDHSRTIIEHTWLIQLAMVLILPQIKLDIEKDFTISSVEKEHRIPLIGEPSDPAGLINWYSREDGVIHYTDDSSPWVFSFKTVEKYQPYMHLEQAHWAMQNVSEPWSVEQDGGPLGIRGVVMLWYEVGALEDVRTDGYFRIDSPLVNPYFDGKRYFFQYRWKDAAGNSCQVPKGAKRTPVYRMMSIGDWVKKIVDKEVIGFNPRSLYYGPVLFERPRERQVSWLTQIKSRALSMRAKSELLRHSLDQQNVNDWKWQLDTHYPQSEQHCRRCPFTELCYGSNDALLTIGKKFTIRKPREEKQDVISSSEAAAPGVGPI